MDQIVRPAYVCGTCGGSAPPEVDRCPHCGNFLAAVCGEDIRLRLAVSIEPDPSSYLPLGLEGCKKILEATRRNLRRQETQATAFADRRAVPLDLVRGIQLNLQKIADLEAAIEHLGGSN